MALPSRPISWRSTPPWRRRGPEQRAKGFAVVADEVRSLATKRSEAAVSSTVYIDQSVQAVIDGTAANETAGSLGRATEIAGIIAGTLDTIFEATTAQSGAIVRVNSDVEQINSVVQTNSATAEQSAAACEELSGQSQILKAHVKRFRLRSQAPSTVQTLYLPEREEVVDVSGDYSN